MGIDYISWRIRIGLNNCRLSRYACRSLPVQWRAARGGLGEVMNSTLLFQSCMAVVFLSLKVSAVLLVLLLLAGDVEKNPGPTGREGSHQMHKEFFAVDNSPLGEDDHFDILREMMPVAGSWKTIGRGLRIDSGHLETIQESNDKKPRECLSELLTCWLKGNYNVERFGEPTWRAVVKVVADPAGGDNHALALSIAEQHADFSSSNLMSPSPSTTTTKCDYISSPEPSLLDTMEATSHPKQRSEAEAKMERKKKRKEEGEAVWFMERGEAVVEGGLKANYISDTHSELATVFQTTKQNLFRSQDHSCACKPKSDSPEGASVRSRRKSFGCGCGKCMFLGYNENGCPNPISTTSSFPYLNVSGLTDNQQEELKIKLYEESKEMVIKFQRLISKVYESLCDRKVPVKKLVTHLFSLGVLDPVSKNSQKPLLQAFQQELRNAECIEDVLWVIRDYFSFFNYHVIEHIVSGLGTEQDKLELQNYKEEFQQYSKRRIYECPPVYGPMSDIGHTNLVLKVDSVYEQFTVKELKSFRYRLSKIFYVSPQSVLRLCQVEEGCLQLTFQVPSFVQQEIFPLSSEQESALAAEGVIKLTCGDYLFTAKRDEKMSESEYTDTDSSRTTSMDENCTCSVDKAQSTFTDDEEAVDKKVSQPKDPTELRDQMFQAALTVHAINTDSAMGTSFFTEDRSSCRFSDDEEKLENTFQIPSEHQRTEDIQVATRRGSLETVRFYADKENRTPLEKDEDGNTTFLAAQAGSLEVFKNYNPHCERTPLHMATEHVQLDGHIRLHSAAEDLIDKQRCLNNKKETPLHYAAAEGRLDIVKFLTLEKHCNPTSRNSSDITPIHWAAHYGHLDVLKFFISDLKCSPHIPGISDRTPLHSAAGRGHLHIVKYLIDEQGCDPSHLDRDKETPLHLAASKGHLSIVKFLTLEKGCDPASRNSFGITPIHWAARYGHLEILTFFISNLEYDPSILGQSDRTPLHNATEKSHLHILKYLIDEQGCNPSSLDRDERTPLHYAAHNGHLDVVKFLTLEKHCNPSQRDICNNTPLHFAVRNGHLQVVKFLEELKYPPNVRNHQLAETKGHHNNKIQWINTDYIQ